MIKRMSISNVLSNHIRQTAYAMFSQTKRSEMISFPIHQYEVGERLDRYLKKTPIGWISAQINLRSKNIIVKKSTGQTTRERSYRLNKGDQILMTSQLSTIYSSNKNQISSVTCQQAKQSLDKMILFDNQHISIINKPSGYSVQGGNNVNKNLFTLMAARYRKQIVHVTHRLDKCTSGIVIMAKHRDAAQLIQKSMENRSKIHKYYIALTSGEAIGKSAYIRCNIEFIHGKARICRQNIEQSRDCVTFYTPLQFKSDKQLYPKVTNYLGMKLLTGRKHQIRCHLGHYLEAPIYNDKKYGGIKAEQQLSIKQQSIYLHAFAMKLTDSELIQSLFKKQQKFMNRSLGGVQINDKEVIITGNVPQMWPDSIKESDLSIAMTTIENQERSMSNKKPNKRTIIEIK